MATLTWLGVPGDEHAWTTMGFAVDDRAIRIGRVRCALTDERGWGFDEIYARPEVLGFRRRFTRRSPARCIPAVSPMSTTWSTR